MRKFVIRSTKGSTSIVEVECEVMPKFYSYSLKEDQWMAKITTPTFLYEKDFNNKLVPPVWCWWAFYDSVEDCLDYLKISFRESTVRQHQKRSRLFDTIYVPFTEEELDKFVAGALSTVQVVML